LGDFTIGIDGRLVVSDDITLVFDLRYELTLVDFALLKVHIMPLLFPSLQFVALQNSVQRSIQKPLVNPVNGDLTNTAHLLTVAPTGE
jgi:hypothetical protein